MPSSNRQREFALEVVTKLRAAGFEALWAGGCVRDELLGLVPKDYDVATNALPEQVRELFGHRRTLPIGASFGVVTVLGPRAAGQIEVATFRTDAAYSDGRHPDSVAFTDAQHDAQRRDFTINGLFYDPLAKRVVDYVGGQIDLQQRIVRAIGDPHARLHEDRLRMLRAVRFAAAFGYEIEPATRHAIQAMAAEVLSVSAERIGTEVRRMLLDAHRDVALQLLAATGLLSHVAPEVAQLSKHQFDDTLRLLRGLHEPTLPSALAALLFHVPTADAAGVVGRRLRFTNKEIERTAWILSHRAIVASAPQVSWPCLQRVLVHDGIAELIALHQANAGPADCATAFCIERLGWPPERLNPAPLLDGAALIAHGLQPGPRFSYLLEAVRDAQLNGEIATTTEALALVDSLL